MLEKTLSLFPPAIHPLTLVSDPDRLLASMVVMTEFVRRGFRVIQENDPVLLRHRVEESHPFSSQQPVVIITMGALEDLPYDIYQPAYRLSLSLHQYFPNLSYPVLQVLMPDQVERLSYCLQPNERLSQRKTMDYLLREVFNADPATLRQPHLFIAWLDRYHQRQSELPKLLRSRLVQQLQRLPAYRGWEIDELIRNDNAFRIFLQQQWEACIERSLPGSQVKESDGTYFIRFDTNTDLQDMVPNLVRQGTITPLEIADSDLLPSWAHAGVTMIDARLQRFTVLLEDIEIRIRDMSSHCGAIADWNMWRILARDWAELCGSAAELTLTSDPVSRAKYQTLTREVDTQFAIWLKDNYSLLGAQRLPNPNHVHHVPHYLNYLHQLGQAEQIVLLVLDGLSLIDWHTIQSAWASRHALWEMHTKHVLAQIPTITSISRYGLISGLRPDEFIDNSENHPSEKRAWELFWTRQGQSTNACDLLSLSYDRQIDQLPELSNPKIKFWCLIDDTPDKLAHHATLGMADQQVSLRLWLDPTHEQNSVPLEELIDSFLERDYTVFIASDHGHVEASGFGRPSEGLLANTRGQRARIYRDQMTALRVKNAFVETILWEDDGLLPENMTVLMPAARHAFALDGERTVTHGGISIEETIVPLIQLTKVSKG